MLWSLFVFPIWVDVSIKHLLDTSAVMTFSSVLRLLPLWMLSPKIQHVLFAGHFNLIRIDSKSHWYTEQIFLVFITEWGWEGSLLIYLKHVTLNIFIFQWKVPKEMHQIIYNLPPSVEQAFVYLLIGKACHCIDVRVSLSVCLSLSLLSLCSFSRAVFVQHKSRDRVQSGSELWKFGENLTGNASIEQIFERARQLLLVADRNVYEVSYILSKYVRWYILLADLLQFYTTKSFGMNTTLQDLIKKTKTCITSVRLDQGDR